MLWRLKVKKHMWRKIGLIALVIAIWGAIATYVVYSAMLVHKHKQEQNVERLAIEIVDSTASGQLITSQRVREMLLYKPIPTIGVNVNMVDHWAIKELICKEGFVDNVSVYTSYNGTLHISISQRTPLLRLRVGGYDSYITADGYVFNSPQHGALHTPVVSGALRPLFKAGYEGSLKDLLSEFMAQTELEAKAIMAKAEPVLERKEHLQQRRKDVRDSTIESKAERKRLYRNIDGHIRDCDNALAAIEAEREALYKRAEMTRLRFEDFEALLAFVSQLSADRFWRSEIVQIVATTTADDRIWLMLIPRSGNHRIEFGWVEDCGQKLHKLRLVYDKIAATSGWESFSCVNLNYADKIVCTYNEKK